MAADGYNGWTNWETWNVALWAGNEEGLYRAIVNMVPPAGYNAESAAAEWAVLMAVTPDGVKADDPAINWTEIADCFNDLAGIAS